MISDKTIKQITKTVGMIIVAYFIANIVTTGLEMGHDGVLILSGIGGLCTIFGYFFGKRSTTEGDETWHSE